MRRPGLTLVELLVVVTIIGILIALLLPAVQAAREAARCAQCKNHLKQLSLGWQEHQEAHEHYPVGGWHWSYTGDPDAGFRTDQPGGWPYNTLPFIEQEAFRFLGQGKAGKDQDGNGLDDKHEAIAELRQAVIPAFYCPTRRDPCLIPCWPGHSTTINCPIRVTHVGTTDYAANGGGDGVGFQTPSGVVGSRCEVQAAHVTDGLSNTYMLFEKGMNSGNYHTGNHRADNDDLFQGHSWDNARWTRHAFPPVKDCVDEYMVPVGNEWHSEWGAYAAGSPHPGRFNAAMCDGSVHSVSFQIDAEAHYRLGARNDSKPVSAADW
jgi:prepilin-type N-terminal cleavage/methylation domain-containing protein/prepilin-type processing-associated H-X9-DG protein